MLNFLDKLRQKPEKIRLRYAFGISLSVVIVLVIIWTVTLPGRFSKKNEQTTANEPSPLSALIQNIKGGISTLKENLSQTNPFTQTAAVSNSSTTASTATSSDVYNNVIITDPQ